MDSSGQLSVFEAARRYWATTAERLGRFAATRALFLALWEFLLDSTPSRLRQRYGDADYDWDHRVNTTSAAVAWRDRLLGVFHSPYQPTDPALFHDMLERVRELSRSRDTGSAGESMPHQPLDYRDLTFLDLGSGKGRTLLMASDFPFRRIVGVEILPTLHDIAQQNLRRYKSDSQECFALEAVCADATTFPLPEGILLIYLFNPFPESGLRQFVANLEASQRAKARPLYVLYYNPLLEHVFAESRMFKKISSTHQYSVWYSR